MRKIIMNLVMALALVVPILAQPAVTYAACPRGNTAQAQVLRGVGQTGSNCSTSEVNKFTRLIVNILSFVTGIAAIIVIILSGFRYITSAGDSGRVTTAKNTLIYAMVGLAIAAVAQILVHFVLFRVGTL